MLELKTQFFIHSFSSWLKLYNQKDSGSHADLPPSIHVALDKWTTVLSITTSYLEQASGVHSMWYSQHKIQSTLKSPGLLDVYDIAASTVWIQNRYEECGQLDRESGEERRECVDSKKKKVPGPVRIWRIHLGRKDDVSGKKTGRFRNY